MPKPIDPSRDLLFGLLALQNGLIDQGALFAAFAAWTRDKSQLLADHLVALGHLDAGRRAVVDAMAGLHVQAHGGDIEKSLAAVPAGRLTRASLAAAGGPDVTATLGRIGTPHPATNVDNDDDPDRTASVALGSATSDGQRFRIVRPHARGGLGAVFVAVDSELHREVALKQILEKHADDPVSRQRFVAEAEITGGLEHPGVVPVYGLGTDAHGRPYYAMRFIKGDSLKEAIARFHEHEGLEADSGRRSLELRKLIRRFSDVCNAIDYAHSRGVIHRDIKPANIIVGKHGETLVVDWGLAKAVGRADPTVGEQTLAPSSGGSSETLPGSALGTPAYMSPEQALGDVERQGPRSDVYSLGATLYCILTGKPPFASDDVGEILRGVRDGRFPRPRQLAPSLDKALEAVCLKAMATRPDDRYTTPRALAEDLERWMADEPVSAWREPFGRRARRRARQNRTAVTALAASMLVALAGTTAVLAVQTRANADLTSANLELEIANGRIAQANTDLKSANDREKLRFALALDAIKLFHGEVSEDLLMKEKQFEGLRTKLLKGAADFYGRLEGLLKGQTDRESRAALGNAYSELGELTKMIGDQTAALAIQRKALAVRRSLASQPEVDAESTLDVARSLLAVGSLQRSTGDMAGARASYDEALSLADKAMAHAVAPEQAEAAMGTAYHRAAIVLSETGDTTGARVAYGKALVIRQKLVDANPGVTQFRRDLAMRNNNLARLLSDTGDKVGARTAHSNAIAIQQKLVGANPGVTQFQSDLAQSNNNLAILLSVTGDKAGARTAHSNAIGIQQKLVESNPSVTEFRSDLALWNSNLANLLSDTGDKAGARTAYSNAIAIQQKLVGANPSVTQFQSDLAQSNNNLAILLSDTGDKAGARTAHSIAIAIQQKLVESNPSVTRFQSDLATSNNNLAILLSDTGDKAGARTAHSIAIAILQKLVESNPSVTRFQSDLATSKTTLGLLLSDTGDLAGARAAYCQALAIQQKLVDANPIVVAYQDGLATSLANFGLVLARSGTPGEAIDYLSREEAIRKTLADSNPTVTQYRYLLANCQTNTAAVLIRLGRPTEALAKCQQAVTRCEALLSAHSNAIEYRPVLADALLRSGLAHQAEGNPTRASADWKRAVALLKTIPDQTGELVYVDVCCHASLSTLAGLPDTGVRAGERGAEADRAMSLLRRAASMGFSAAYTYRTESALDPLRDRPDFRALMLDLAFPNDPFAPDR